MKDLSNLWNLEESQSAKVEDFDGAFETQMQTRLKNLGFNNGNQIKCLKKLPFDGPRSFQVSDSVFCLEKDIAEKIKIGPIE